ncbi:MAG TPA: Gfo/Idh/MocA family oxidoreductase [Chitinophagaceae bacterium]|nr:Gfo/Idh/MocA family oxidoreductase [Chitinophagaceae bacterium]
MVKVAVIGLGKMGISHLAILGAHPEVEVVGVCDASGMIMDAIGKYSPFRCFTDHKQMLAKTEPDAVVIAVPTRFHSEMVEDMLERGLHVFVEKPFCLDYRESERLAELAEKYQLVNQVGYHNKFIGTFNEAKKIIDEGLLGDIYHFHGQSYGPVVVKPKQSSWRTNAAEGGGCLMDYASHVIDLINYLLAPVHSVEASMMPKVFSGEVKDAVYAMVSLENKVRGMISVNWSDDTYRKMTTSITVNGTKGKLVTDANELRLFLKEASPLQRYEKGWNTRYVTDLTPTVDFYLRGEEYSAQIDHFIAAIMGRERMEVNSFKSAAITDRAIKLIKEEQI